MHAAGGRPVAPILGLGSTDYSARGVPTTTNDPFVFPRYNNMFLLSFVWSKRRNRPQEYPVAFAQSSDSSISFDIPAQPLGGALTAGHTTSCVCLSGQADASLQRG
jgi:hypothetical protein